MATPMNGAGLRFSCYVTEYLSKMGIYMGACACVCVCLCVCVCVCVWVCVCG